MGTTRATGRVSRLAIASVIVGAAGLTGPYASLYAMIWITKTAIPGGPEFAASLLPLLPPLVAVVCGHAALVATRHNILRGRRAGWLGLALGYAGLVQTAGFIALLWFILWAKIIQY